VVALRRPHAAHAPTAAATDAPAAADTALSADRLRELAASVKARYDARRWNECLPDARALTRQFAMRGALTAAVQVDFARLLNNAAVESGDHAPRSTCERVALTREALDVCRHVIEARGPAVDRAAAMALVAQMNEVWGYSYDAYVMYAQAVALDPANTRARVRLAAYRGGRPGAE